MTKFIEFLENGTPILIDVYKIAFAIPHEEHTLVRLDGFNDRYIHIDLEFEEFKKRIGIRKSTNQGPRVSSSSYIP